MGDQNDRAVVVNRRSGGAPIRRITLHPDLELTDDQVQALNEMADAVDRRDDTILDCTIYAGALIAQVRMTRDQIRELTESLPRWTDPTAVLLVDDYARKPPRRLHIRRTSIDAIEVADDMLFTP